MPADRTPTPPKAKPEPKAKTKAEPADPSASASSSPKPKPKRTPWTDEEERIFDELATALLKKGMWSAVVADGRLKHRGANGIASHVVAKFKK